MSRLTCNAILRLVYADFTSSERLSVRRNLLGIYNILSYSTSVILLLRKILTCPSGKLSTEFSCPIEKSTSPGLSTRLSLHADLLWYGVSIIIHVHALKCM